ncbi:hypothetical protein Tco_1471116 [Tanacetum coccineum]
MLERSTGIAGVTKTTLGPEAITKNLRHEGAAARPPKGPQLEEGENLNTEVPGTRRTPLGGTSAPARQVQGGPSPAFVKKTLIY